MSAVMLTQAVYPPLQHLFNLLGAVVIKVFNAELFTSLRTVYEFAFNPQSAICYFFAGIVADFLAANSCFSEVTQLILFFKVFEQFESSLLEIYRSNFSRKGLLDSLAY